MSHRWSDRLSEYLDRELPEGERRELEAHLATCAECRDILLDLTVIAERARTAPLTPPAVDLWPAIAARISGATSESAPEAAPSRAPRRTLGSLWSGWRFTLTLPQAAAVAATLMVVAGASVWMALTRGPIPATRGPATSASTPSASPNLADRTAANPPESGETSPGSGTAAVASFDTPYDATVAELQRLLAEDRDRLSPRTVKVLERNLATIDHALAEARRAVEADPSNLYLRNHLANVMKRKIDLLKTATLIATERG